MNVHIRFICCLGSGCHNKIQQTTWLDNRKLFLKVLEAGKSKIKVLASLVYGKISLPLL